MTTFPSVVNSIVAPGGAPLPLVTSQVPTRVFLRSPLPPLSSCPRAATASPTTSAPTRASLTLFIRRPSNEERRGPERAAHPGNYRGPPPRRQGNKPPPRPGRLTPRAGFARVSLAT